MRSFRPLVVERLEIRELMAADGLAVGTSADDDPPLLLAAEGETTPIVEYVFRTLAPGTMTPITSILAGRDFDLELRVRDLRNDGNKSRGVYAAYVDLFYDKSLAKVRVPEIQSITNVGALTGSFTLTYGGGLTTAPIVFDLDSVDGAAAFPGQLETALNNLLGPGMVKVAPDVDGYQIRFVGQADVDQPTLQSSSPDFTVREVVKGDPNLAASFTEAFRSMDLGLNNGLPSPFQNGLSAVDAADRIDELGAQVSFTATRNSLVEVTRVRMRAQLPTAQASGNLTFTPSFSQIVSPVHDTLVFADINKIPPENSLVPASQITALPIALNVSAALVGSPLTATIDEDHAAGVAIPILPHVIKNAAAPAGATELRSFSEPLGGRVRRVDPNNTPGDLTDDLLKFIPDADFSGTTSFVYVAGIVGDSLPSDTAINTVTVTVNPVNDAPLALVPGPQTMLEDGTLSFAAATGNGVSVADVDAGPADVQVSLAVSNGTLAVAPAAGINFSAGQGTNSTTMTFSGSMAAVNAALAGLTFQPLPDFNGNATISLTVNDQGLSGAAGSAPLTAQTTIAVTVTAVNDQPTLVMPGPQIVYAVNPLQFSPAFQNAISVADVDAGSDSIRVSISASNGVGTLSVSAVAGVDISGSGASVLTITGPQAAINATLGTLLLTIDAGAHQGVLTVTVDDQQHNPGPNLSASAPISIVVLAATAPFAVNDVPLGLLEGAASYVVDVMANDLTSGTGKAALLSFTQPAGGGTVERFDPYGTPGDFTDDKLVYRPPLKNGQLDLDFFVPDTVPPVTFSYTISEVPAVQPNPLPGTVSIRIANVPDAPLAAGDGVNPYYATTISTPLVKAAAQGLLFNDASIDNGYGMSNVATLTVLGATADEPLVVNTTNGGTVTIKPDGSFTYFPLTGLQGNDTFTYRVHSSLGIDSVPATVTIHVSAAPIAGNDFLTATEDTPFVSTSLLGNDGDAADGEPLSAVLVSNVPPAMGSVSLSTNGIVTYTPAENFNTTQPPVQPVFFTYRVTTPSGRQSSVATVFVTVNEVNDNPLATDDEFRAARNNGVFGIDQVVPVLGNDSAGVDAGEELFVVAINGGAANGVGQIGAIATSGGGLVRLDGFQIKYTSPPTAGPDGFSYTISDGRGGLATAFVLVNVSPLYDFGDAPASYGTAFAADGPRHVASGARLGDLRDEETDGAAAPLATGDDANASDDEDGLLASAVICGEPSSVTLRLSGAAAAKLDAWIDFNDDGQFSDEEKISDSGTIAAGDSQVLFTAPASAQIGPTIARFRVSSAGGLLPTGVATDGEVEDHVVTIGQDLEFDLPTGASPNKISIRRDGADLHIYDLVANALLASSPLELTRSVVVYGSPTQIDEMTVDYGFGGFFSVPGGIHLDGGTGGGDLLRVNGAAGSTTSAHYVSQGLSLGNATVETTEGDGKSDIEFTNFEPLAFTGIGAFTVEGTLNVGADMLDLGGLSAPIELGSVITLSGGKLLVPSGIKLDAANTISGFGTIETPLDAAKPLVNNGSIQGVSAEQPITLTGYVKGIGTLDHVVIAGILSPGASPAIVNYGSVLFTAAAKLIVEIGGAAPGAFDQINFTGVLKLNGSLEISLINGYFPDFNDSFSFLNGGLVQDTFSFITLPTLNADKKWRTTYGSTKFTVSAVATHPWYNRARPHDVDDDRTISASDVIAVINYINALPPNDPAKVPVDAPEVKPFRDTDKDNFVTASDALGIINYLNAGLTTEGEGAGSGDPRTTSLASSALSEVLGLIAADIAESVGKKK